MTTLMSPQSFGPRSNESFTTTESPNTTPTTTRSKRTNDSLDELESDSSGSEDIDWNDDNGKKKLAAIESEVKKILAPYNKRSKHSLIVPIFTIQDIQSTIPRVTNDDTQSAHGCGIGSTGQSCRQATQAQQELQAPLSYLPSNLSSLFSQERPQDTQSELSQAHSTSTSYFHAGKDCKACLKHLTLGYPSEFKNHFWPTHYPQELYYCLFCKCGVIDVEGVLFWQCKKCLLVHGCEMDAVTHFSNRHLPCYQRKGHWKRAQPWKEHVQAHLLAECFEDIAVGPGQYLKQCIYCQKTFSDVLDSKKHSCPFTTWNSKMPAPLPACCVDHPDADFSTVEKIDEHIESMHIGESKAGSTKSKRRNKSQKGSIQRDFESGHDSHSQNCHDAHASGQQDDGAVPTASDPTIDLQGGLGPGPNLQIPHYPQGLALGDEGGASQRPSRSRTLAPKRKLHPELEEPRVYANIVTDDGRPKFLRRRKS